MSRQAREVVYKFSSRFINNTRSRRRVPELIRQMWRPCSRWVRDTSEITGPGAMILEVGEAALAA
jgi:hypothetical protein